MALKVVHLAASVRAGGAASALINLHTGLSQMGVESSILAGDGDPRESHHLRIVKNPLEAVNRLVYRELIHRHRTALSNTHFSFDVGGIFLNAAPEVLAADIIHLHWVANYLTSPSLSALAWLRKPIVWTLHDMRPFTGGCHYSAGCQGFRQSCQACPQLQPELHGFPVRAHLGQSEVIRSLRPILVAPSKWLAGECQSSSAATSSRVEVIPYGIDTSIFAPVERREARERLGLDQNALYVMLGAHSFEEIRKGAAIARQVLHGLAQDPSVAQFITNGNWRVVSCGAEYIPLNAPWRAQHLGRLSKQEMASLCSASDLLLFTAQEDNFPNIILEAMACGLCVVACRVGGVPELVEHGKTGLLAEPFDIAGLGEHVKAILRNVELKRALGQTARQVVTVSFTLEAQARLYRDLYARQIARGPETTTPAGMIPEANLEAIGLTLNALESKRQVLDAEKTALTAEKASLTAHNTALEKEKSALLGQNHTLTCEISKIHSELSLLRKWNHYLRRQSLAGFVKKNMRIRWRLYRRRSAGARRVNHLMERLIHAARRSRRPDETGD